MAPTLVWLRDDLRLGDNPALTAALQCDNDDLIICFVFDEKSPGIRPLGGATRWWLHHSLASLSRAVTALGSQLVLRSGQAGEVIRGLVAETGADRVLWNRRYAHPERTIDAELKSWCADNGVEATSYQANLLFEPWQVSTGAGGPYKVFTPFWRACMGQPEPRAPLPAPERLAGPTLPSEELSSWDLLPTTPDWAAGLQEQWTPGEEGAWGRVNAFLDGSVEGYAANRDLPGVEGTSRLSPHLRFGEISPFQIWHESQAATNGAVASDIKVFGSEVGWREFCWQLLYHNTDLATQNYRREFDGFAWQTPTPGELGAWQRGQTGYPLIDAGMRQLWDTGWMHNRVRMATASFLIKNLMVDWRVGEQWFWDTLVDADSASNPANWQWVAGSGADASPYFRIFNPVTQSKKFDSGGIYLKRFVPELREAANVHEPWKAAQPPKDYPAPVVDLAATRERALSAYQDLRAD
ncbi:deoxyribodipyrimidine photo-lyase [Arthrobacter sp. H20]|uniref:cryptochrome/photolyase family protein n=1 Tax=Arthrobacter sp. H20 TaxID=1267981 RepID=UPI00047D1F1E|nr:deoxyribodipyrimidine photo-lyase [Arthrobacter sp. H20]